MTAPPATSTAGTSAGGRQLPGPAGGQSSQQEIRRSTRSGAAGLAGAAVSGAFGFVLTVVITQGFGTVGSGAFFTAIGLVTVAGGVCCLGAETGLIWAVPRRRVGPSGDAARLLPVALVPPLVASVLVAAAGVLLAPELAPLLFDEIGAAGIRLLRLVFTVLPVAVAMILLIAVVRGVRSMKAYVAVQFLLLPVARPALVGLVALAGGGVVFGMAGWLVPNMIAMVVCIVLAVGPLGLLRGAPVRPQRADWQVFWRFALPRAASAAIDAASMWVGVLLTAALAGQAEAGVFGAVGRYVLAGQLAMQGLRVAVSPQLSKLMHAERFDEAAAVHRQTTIWVVVLSWPVYLLLAVFSPGFLQLFGAGFGSGASAMTVLAVAMLVNVGLGNVQSLLLMSGKSGQHLVATVVGLGSNVALGLLLIPAHGALGAAVAWSVGIVLENVIAAGAARSAVHRPIIGLPMVLAAVTVAAVVAGASMVSVPLAGRGVGGLLLALGLLAAACAALLAVPSMRQELRGTLSVIRQKPGAGSNK